MQAGPQRHRAPVASYWARTCGSGRVLVPAHETAARPPTAAYTSRRSEPNSSASPRRSAATQVDGLRTYGGTRYHQTLVGASGRGSLARRTARTRSPPARVPRRSADPPPAPPPRATAGGTASRCEPRDQTAKVPAARRIAALPSPPWTCASLARPGLAPSRPARLRCSLIPGRSGQRAVGLAAMADADDQDDELLVGDLVDDPVVADAQPVPVGVAGELLDIGVRSPRILPQGGSARRMVSAAVCGMVRSWRTARSRQRNAYFTRRSDRCLPRRSRLPPRTCCTYGHRGSRPGHGRPRGRNNGRWRLPGR